jgi:glycosyltransferase involved in cell wall biosynthesis
MKALRIGIDGYNFAIPHGTGIASYGLMLAKTLTTMGHEIDGLFGIDPGSDPSLHEVLFYERLARPVPAARLSLPKRLAVDLGLARPRIVPIVPSGLVETEAFSERLPAFQRIWTGARLFDAALRRFRATGKMTQISLPDPPDIIHWTYPVPLRVRGIPNVYTIHDLVPLKLPHATLDRKPEFKALVDACIASAAQICTVSAASQHDIEDMFPQARGLVTNTYQVSSLLNGEGLCVRSNNEAALKAFGLTPKGYFLFFGAIEPKKNIGRLLEAYLSLDTDTPLVLVSSRSWQSDEELTLLDESASNKDGHKSKSGIVRINHVPRSVLTGLIAQAKAVLFPSLYEGFGLPAHEAMLMGTPVLTSDRGGLREVAGEAAVLIDPYDAASIAVGLSRLDADDRLRETLATAGKEHAARFSIEKYRTSLDLLYARALEKRGRATIAVERGAA